MTREEAVQLISELVAAEVEVMKQMASRGKVTKKADLREKAAAVAIFNALVDEHPTEREVLQMVGM